MPNIPSTFYFSTIHSHFNNTHTMSVFLEEYLPDDYEVVSQDGTYAEIISSDGTVYGVHASGNGDFNNHKIEFEAI